MLIRDLIKGVIRHFPALDPDDAYQELAVCVWSYLKSEGVEYSEDLEVEEDLRSRLFTACWRECINFYGTLIAQKRDYRRQEPLDPERPVSREPDPHTWAVMGELKESLLAQCPVEPMFVQALVEGSDELTAHQADVIENYIASGNRRRVMPDRVLTLALARHFARPRRTVLRWRRCVEATVQEIVA